MQSAAIEIDGKPAWDLTAPEACFPIRVEHESKEFEVYVVLKQPYDSGKLIDAITKSRGGFRRTAGSVENIAGDHSPMASIADDLFISMEGTTVSDPAVQRQWLSRNFQLRVKIIIRGLGGVVIKPREEFEAAGDSVEDVELPADNEAALLPIALDVASDVSIETQQELYNGQKKVLITMEHLFRPETEKDWRRWQRTSAETYVRAANMWKEVVAWHQRLDLYNQMIKSVRGMYLGNVPCTEANKAAWLDKVPAWHKLYVIEQVFREAKVKN